MDLLRASPPASHRVAVGSIAPSVSSASPSSSCRNVCSRHRLNDHSPAFSRDLQWNTSSNGRTLFPSLQSPLAPRHFIPVATRPPLICDGAILRISGSSRVRSRISASATSPGRASPYFLQQNYGSPFVHFSGAAGIRTVELSTSDESTCRILIDGARVTSYRAMMWHGAVEEVLYAATNDDDVDGDDSPGSCNLIRGGLVVSFPASGALTAGSGRRVPLGELAAQGEWEVTSASNAPNGSWAK
ncbi:unnamed protein product, partial [Closterium sp. NIES-54]